MIDLNGILSLLPHQPPFRFVDEVIEYIPSKSLIAKFSPKGRRIAFGNSINIPFSILVEGLAQTAVLYTQIETEPLSEGDIPVLGNMEASYFKEVCWDEDISYKVEPFRIFSKKAILNGKVYGPDGQLIIAARLSVAVSRVQIKG
ncbi:3-hydroxyacyl-ACP dehydratase FabZ family protein [Cytobacillus oceanisediminis]|uniref:3-hydroxyacyl-ACP dehydratase FabZ family protein n=1 Tax=Cytobacillus oceanisediminis TaxID=665099 RepID=UPI001C23DD3E|nr:FabA-like domain protein [Cytobacillus oceanisediminis]MBU8772115.1 FabA-like domain protein [Cytobacillus oceanisediminis]